MRKFLNIRFVAMAAFLCLSILPATGCSRAQQAEIGAWGQRRHIKQYSGGKLINEWYSTGLVKAEAESDGYYFEDEKTHTVVRVSGDIQILIAD
jgi:hypothetical protein